MNEYGMSWYSIAGLFFGMFVLGPFVRWAHNKYESRKRKLTYDQNK